MTIATDEESAFENWLATYQPQANTITPTNGFDGKLYETFGPEKAAALTASILRPGSVWTLVDNGGDLAVSPGYWLCNRLGYFVCAVLYDVANSPDDITIESSPDEE